MLRGKNPCSPWICLDDFEAATDVGFAPAWVVRSVVQSQHLLEGVVEFHKRWRFHEDLHQQMSLRRNNHHNSAFNALTQCAKMHRKMTRKVGVGGVSN